MTMGRVQQITHLAEENQWLVIAHEDWLTLPKMVQMSSGLK